jgi:Na+-driven multidrug efflux pump
MVGTSIGAGNQKRALQVAITGSLFAFGITETIGIVCAIWPKAWLDLFSHDPQMQATGVAYLHAVGPFYGFFGLGLSLYFASQGAGKLFWPLASGTLRVLVALGGAWLALHFQMGPMWFFLALGIALLVYGSTMSSAIYRGGWFKRS